MRLNARFDAAAEQCLVYLVNATGQTASHVVREAIAQYYVQVRGARARPAKFLALAGTGDSGRSDIASNVKAFVGSALADKFKHAAQKPAAK